MVKIIIILAISGAIFGCSIRPDIGAICRDRYSAICENSSISGREHCCIPIIGIKGDIR